MANASFTGNFLRLKPAGKLHLEYTEKGGIKEALPEGTALRVDAATGNYYKVTLPDGNSGYLNSKAVAAVEAPLRKLTPKAAQALYAQPDTISPRKTILTAGKPVDVLGSFESFYLVEAGKETGWVKK